MADLTDTIETNAAQPKRVTVDGTSVEQHSLPDQIEADQHVKAKKSAAKPHFGLRMTKLIPPGAG
ncbi:MAG: hypothetical protein IID33_16915 [Planctomycetes bacterium]|nr:hypothetical protein [Planctomycetota bacterium]